MRPNFNSKWIKHGRFCDGFFQGVPVQPDYVRVMHEQLQQAARANMTGFWTPAVVNQMEAEAKAALAAAKGKNLEMFRG